MMLSGFLRGLTRWNRTRYLLASLAAVFAAELLMPKKLLAGALDDRMLDLDDDRLLALAKRFKVSLMALQYRLQRI